MNFDNHNNNEDMFEDYMVHKMSTEDTLSDTIIPAQRKRVAQLLEQL